MMEEIYKWTVSAIVILAVGSIVLFLSPSSSISKSVRTVTVLCVLLVFFSPIINLKSSDGILATEQLNQEEMNEEIKNQMLHYAELEAEEVCENIVVQADCVLNKIEAKANIDENNSIYISKVKLYLDEKYKDKKELISEKVNKVLNTESEFIWEKK